MNIIEITENKKEYLTLLLLADEQEDMIDRYLDNGRMYVLDDNGIKCECVVTDEGNGVLEIKNIATVPEYQGEGYAKALIDFIIKKYREQYIVLQVGTGDSPLTIPFYEKCGFVRSHIIPNFFTDNYDHPIYEGGIQLVDMVYLQRRIWIFRGNIVIRVFKENDISVVMQIWLDTNIKTHSFISKCYWMDNYDMVKKIMPPAEIYVYEDNITNQIEGFIGLMDNYIAGLFVKEGVQSKGIGKQLLNYAKGIKSNMRLSVYNKNIRAIKFYQREQFVIQSENTDDNTNEKELIMVWSR